MGSEKYYVSLDLKWDANFATAVTVFAQMLEGGNHIGMYSDDDIITVAHINKGGDTFGDRFESIQLVHKAKITNVL